MYRALHFILSWSFLLLCFKFELLIRITEPISQLLSLGGVGFFMFKYIIPSSTSRDSTSATVAI